VTLCRGDNLWITSRPGPLRRCKFSNSQSPRTLPFLLHSFPACRLRTGRARRTHGSSFKILWLFSGIFYCPGLDSRMQLRYITRSSRSCCVRIRKEDMPLLLVLLPVKLYILWVILNILFGG